MMLGIQIDNFYTGMLLIIGGSLIFALLHGTISRLLKREDVDGEAIGGYFGVVGTLYAVLIGLIIYDATLRYGDASNNIASEASSIGEVYLYLEHFKSGAIGDEINGLMIDYVDEVASRDWGYLAEDENNPKAREILSRIMRKIMSIEPRTKVEEIYLPSLVQSLMHMAESRMIRFDKTRHSLQSQEWALLILSASLTLITSLFFRVRSPLAQAALSFILSFSVLASLYAVLMFSEPYKGSFKVSKNQFLLIQKVVHGEFGRF